MLKYRLSRVIVGTWQTLCATTFLYAGSRGKKPRMNITCRSISRELQVRKLLGHSFSLKFTSKGCQSHDSCKSFSQCHIECEYNLFKYRLETTISLYAKPRQKYL